ncbi:hypothetical protein [Bradyrhizobium oligotrophicum]|uniref:hypothetical protein n=1 Tax=Bradyrhizobium oligotrophicum TaxID=44255 RepID=UPI003EBB7F9F
MTRQQPAPVIDESDSRWHVDRKIPLAVILTIVLQTCGVVWWGASINSRIDVLERRADTAAPQADRLTRLEVQVDTIKDGIQEIKAILRPAIKR